MQRSELVALLPGRHPVTDVLAWTARLARRIRRRGLGPVRLARRRRHLEYQALREAGLSAAKPDEVYLPSGQAFAVSGLVLFTTVPSGLRP